MIAIPFSNLQEDLSKTLDHIWYRGETLFVSRPGDRNVIITPVGKFDDYVKAHPK
jgi:hypothetical protein